MEQLCAGIPQCEIVRRLFPPRTRSLSHVHEISANKTENHCYHLQNTYKQANVQFIRVATNSTLQYFLLLHFYYYCYC